MRGTSTARDYRPFVEFLTWECLRVHILAGIGLIVIGCTDFSYTVSLLIKILSIFVHNVKTRGTSIRFPHSQRNCSLSFLDCETKNISKKLQNAALFSLYYRRHAIKILKTTNTKQKADWSTDNVPTNITNTELGW